MNGDPPETVCALRRNAGGGISGAAGDGRGGAQLNVRSLPCAGAVDRRPTLVRTGGSVPWAGAVDRRPTLVLTVGSVPCAGAVDRRSTLVRPHRRRRWNGIGPGRPLCRHRAGTYDQLLLLPCGIRGSLPDTLRLIGEHAGNLDGRRREMGLLSPQDSLLPGLGETPFPGRRGHGERLPGVRDFSSCRLPVLPSPRLIPECR